MKQPQNLTMVSNITIEPFLVPFLDKQFHEMNIALKATVIPYQEYHKPEYQGVLQKSDMIVVWLNWDVLVSDSSKGGGAQTHKEQKITEIQMLSKKLFHYVSENSNADIIWLLFEDYYSCLPIVTGHVSNVAVDELNLKLREVMSDSIRFIDLKHLVAELGISNAFDTKSKYRWNFPYSRSLTETIAAEICKQFLINKGITKKCLVLDCDNVLWGGILSEDGIENIWLGGIGLGREYQEFQRFVLSLYHRGVILTVCSKNDLSDVMRVFREHSEMILQEEHIACFQVNWENKPGNIKKISDRLNIGTESMVFVDDSPFEIEAVKTLLPEVKTILYHREEMYGHFSCFNLKNDLNDSEVIKRTETYRTNLYREQLMVQCDSYNDYIDALEMKIDIHEALPVEYGRIAELTQRTNKCTNGKRYTVADIKMQVASDGIRLYSLFLSDRYSDLGLVGALGIRGNELLLFSLSCRALGREIESKMLLFIKEKHVIKRIDFKSTGKNEYVKRLFEETFPKSEIVKFD